MTETVQQLLRQRRNDDTAEHLAEAAPDEHAISTVAQRIPGSVTR